MKVPRVSIASLMGLVLLVAIGFAALRNPNEIWASLFFSVTLVMLCFGLVGAGFRRGNKQLFWFAFSVFGWTYLALVLATGALKPPNLPTTMLIWHLEQQTTNSSHIGVFEYTIMSGTTVTVRQSAWPVFQIGHSLATLMVALFGTGLALVFAGPEEPPETPRPLQEG